MVQKYTTKRNLFILSLALLGLFVLVAPIIMQNAPVIIAHAAEEGAKAASGSDGSSFVAKLVKWVGGTAGGIVAILLMVSIAKDVFGLATGKGQTSPIKIVGKVLFLILCIGLIYLATNYDSLGNTASDLGQKAVDTINSDANDLLN